MNLSPVIDILVSRLPDVNVLRIADFSVLENGPPASYPVIYVIALRDAVLQESARSIAIENCFALCLAVQDLSSIAGAGTDSDAMQVLRDRAMTALLCRDGLPLIRFRGGQFSAIAHGAVWWLDHYSMRAEKKIIQ